MKIIAEIEPVPLSRTKINTSNRGRYLTARSAKFKSDLGFIVASSMAGQPLFKGLLAVKINLYKNIKVDCKRYGDADNHAKAVLDACNGILFSDDSQIVDLRVIKHKCKTQGLTIEIFQVEKNFEVENWKK